MPDSTISIDENINTDSSSLLGKEKLEILLEEKKQAENTIVFIIKLYSYVFGFLFVYSGFIAKEFLQSDIPFNIEEINCLVPKSYSQDLA